MFTPLFQEGREYPVESSEIFKITTVNEKNKSNLFRKVSSQVRNSKRRSEIILQSLQTWNFELSKSFDIKLPITASAAPLRFLRQQGLGRQLRQPKRVDSYICLSYCWHSDAWRPADGLGQPLSGWPLSPRKVRGLIDQRQNDDEGIWIDAVCINQHDAVEKMHAIGEMDMIYKCARKVVIVLEDIALADSEVSLLENLIANDDDEQWVLPEDSVRPLASILVRILKARWFDRAWCSHEFQLGTASTFLIPTPHACMELPTESLEVLYSRTSDFILADEEYSILMAECYKSYEFYTRAMELSSGTRTARSLMSEFSDIPSLNCFVEADKISIALNVAGLRLLFNKTSISKGDCQFILAMIALSTNDVSVLCGDGDRLTIPGKPTDSWLRWLDDGEDFMTTMGIPHLEIAQSIKRVSERDIELDALFVLDMEPKFPREVVYRAIRSLVTAFADRVRHWPRDDRPAPFTGLANKDEERKDMDFVAEILACSLECGIAWMSHQMGHCKAISEKMRERLSGRELECKDFVRDLLSIPSLGNADEIGTMSEAEFDSILHLLFLFLMTSPLGDGNEPSQYPSSVGGWSVEDSRGCRCGWIYLGASGMALLTLGPGDLSQGHLVVPSALGDRSCAGLRRGWHVVPSESNDGC
ncbi:MAG: hypothetical protein Q9169_006646 [Polycauliona sp. 2 TL-2023]